MFLTGISLSPGPEDTVTVHYRGTLISGQPFDSSNKRGEPATFRLDQVIKGWTEDLQLMHKGAKYELYIPPELAYDKQGPLVDQTLIFEVELISIGKPEVSTAPSGAEGGTASAKPESSGAGGTASQWLASDR